MTSRQLKLMTDHSAAWPLWPAGTAGPDGYGFSPALVTALRDWQDLFDREFHRDTGWRTQDAQDRFARAAVDLLRRLVDEVPPDVRVVLDAWPVTDPKLTAWLTHRRRALEQR